MEKRTLMVSVTQDDIFYGNTASCESCPIALAVNRLLRPDYHVSVVNDRVTVRKSSGREDERLVQWFKLPQTARVFILAFDATVRDWVVVNPFVFPLEVEEYLECFYRVT
jgi:hypothetical protein